MRLGLETFGAGSESVKLEVGGGKGLGRIWVEREKTEVWGLESVSV